MGNITNPSINRWGKNLFWFRLWYTDKNYFLNLQTDNLITNLITIYINYGVSFKLHPFLSKRFFQNLHQFTYKKFANYDLKNFRQDNFINSLSGVEEYYPIRKNQEDIYNTKIGILRFQNWLVVNSYSFKIIKLSRKKARVSRYKYLASPASNYTYMPKKTLAALKRIRFLVFYYLVKNFKSCKSVNLYFF